MNANCYWTVSVSVFDWLIPPEVAVTIRLYVPAGVPFGLGWAPPLLVPPLPPHEHCKHSKNPDANKKKLSLTDLWLAGAQGNATQPSKAIAHIQAGEPSGVKHADGA